MKLLTISMQVKAATKRWDKWHRGKEEEISFSLHCLTENATTEDVSKIIGNNSWVANCYCCNRQNIDLIEIEKGDEWEIPQICLCLACLKAAQGMLECK